MERQRVGRVGVREVAALAEVSLGTVSHYLNTPERVSPRKRERIQQAIDTLGFVRNNAAGQLRNGRSALIGYLAPEVSTPFFGVIAEGVEKRASQEGYSVLIASSHGDAQRELEYLEMFEQNRLQGILVAARHEIEDQLSGIRERGIPSVLISRHAHSDQQPSVNVDDVRGGVIVGEHLLATGRRRIAFIGGPFTIRQVSDRFTGLQSAVSAYSGATVEVIDTADRSIEDGIRIGLALADRPPHLRPDAVFAVNDLLAMGIMQALVSERGVAVPTDIALVGYDDVPFAAASIIPLSSVRATSAGYGEAAFDLLLAQLQPQSPPSGLLPAASHLVFQPELFVRASSAPPA